MNKLFIFALGAAAGSLVTWKILDEKYKAISNEEIASVVEQFEKRLKELHEIKEEPKKTEHYIEKNELDNTITEYKRYQKEVKDLGYSNDDSVVEVPLPKEYVAPYVISPDEFGEFGNTSVSLTLYADGVIADESDEIIIDPESIIGDALEHFGEYEDDSVHVRNEYLECDYEILKSEKTFSEVYKEEN